MAAGNTKKKKKGRISGVVVFLLVFVLFLVIFGGICLWAIVKLNDEKRGERSSSVSLVVSGNVYTQEDARNLFIVSEDGGKSQGFVVVRLDPGNSRIRTMALPQETVVDVGTEEMRLADLYDEKGVTEAQKAVANLLGMEFQNYAVVTYSNLESIITYLNNGVIFTLTENLNYSSDDGSYYIKLSGGKSTLTASQVTDVLRYPVWNGGKRQQAEIQSEMAAAILNQYLNSKRISSADEDFSFIVNKITSNIRVSHYNEMKEPLQYLASRNTDSNICTTVKLEGEYIGSGENLKFIADVSENDMVANTFGSNLQN